MKEATASFLGTVTEAVRGDFFRVALDSGHSVLAKPAGKLQVHHIRLAIGDRVKVEISPYDPNAVALFNGCERLAGQGNEIPESDS